jgi:hypothetical protein
MKHRWTRWDLVAHLVGFYWQRTCRKCGKVQVRTYTEEIID